MFLVSNAKLTFFLVQATNAQTMAPPTFEEFFKNLPYVTKYLIIGSFAMTAMVSLKITKASNYLLDFDMIFDIYKIQVWRLLTNLFFFGGFSFNWVMNFFFLYVYNCYLIMYSVDYCKKVETEVFDGRTADFIFMLIFGCSLMTVRNIQFITHYI